MLGNVSVTARISSASLASSRWPCSSEFVMPWPRISSLRACKRLGISWAVLVDGRVHLGFDRDSQGIEEVQEPPDTDAIPIVTP